MKKLLSGLALLVSLSSFATVMETPFSGEYRGIDEAGNDCSIELTTYSTVFVEGEYQTDVMIKFEGHTRIEIAAWGIRKS